MPCLTSTPTRRAPLLLAAACCLLLLCANAAAQIKFVQVTDPHLFEKLGDNADSKAKAKYEADENLKALRDFVAEVNRHMDNGADYAFVVVTGDIGVESLVINAELQNLDRDKEIKGGAHKLADVISKSKVKTWLFVPGNNDLRDELDDTIHDYYYAFIQSLKSLFEKTPGFTIKDLCPAKIGDDLPYCVPDCQTTPRYAFVGFNNASFKNNNSGCRIDAGEECAQEKEPKSPHDVAQEQLESIGRVKEQADKVNLPVYVFYHIPEVSDPYMLYGDDATAEDMRSNRRKYQEVVGSEQRYSSWFVQRAVREAWTEFSANNKVKGLFAGHLHDKEREHYSTLAWDAAAAASSGAQLAKLNICPPLATKRQPAPPAQQARGFQVVSLDKDGNIADGGNYGVTIYWYVQTSGAFTPEQKQPPAPAPPNPTTSPDGSSQPTGERLKSLCKCLKDAGLDCGCKDDGGGGRRSVWEEIALSASLIGAAVLGAVLGRIARRVYLLIGLRPRAEVTGKVAGEPGATSITEPEDKTSTALSGVWGLAIVLGIVGGAALFVALRGAAGLADLGAYGVGLALGFFAPWFKPKPAGTGGAAGKGENGSPPVEPSRKG